MSDFSDAGNSVPAAPDILAAVAEATSLREGREGVATILRAVHGSGPLPLRDLARIVRMPLPVVGAVRRELETAGLLVRGQGVALSAEGRAFAAAALGLAVSAESDARHRPPRSPATGGDDIADILRPLMPLMEAHMADGPPVDVTLDQAPCTADTALRRAMAMHEAGALEGRRILVIGDDDSISVALSLIARALSIRPRRLTVLELDPARIAHLARGAERHALDFEVIAHDLRQPLPFGPNESFDVFETDPPYTLEGMSLFVSRGIEALEDGPGLPCFLSYADLAPDDMLDLQSRLTEMGLAMSRTRPSFNRYEGASILGSVGQLIELRTTSRTVSLAEGAEAAGPIYTGEVRPRIRRYQCRNCRMIVPVGPSEPFARIEALKEAGCPNCGGKVFSRMHGRQG